MTTFAELFFHANNARVLSHLAGQRFESPDWLQLRLTAEQLALSKGFERLLTLERLPIQLYEHQLRAVLRVLRHMRGRALLADEVGLGKTIEAGVILKEYLLRGLVHRALILVPSTLVSQWKEELQERLAITPVVAKGRGDWQRQECILASLDRAKRPDNAEGILAVSWDMVIVDEAHRLKNRTSVNWQFVNALHKKYLLLLTATPVQNDLGELYNLITLLKPGQLDTYSTFKRRFTIDRHSPRNLSRLRELVDDVMVRTSRRQTLLRLPKRDIRSIRVPISVAERRFYNKLLHMLRTSYLATPKERRNLLPYILLLRQATSHPVGTARTLQAMQRRGTVESLDSASVAELGRLAAELIPSKFRVIEWALRESRMHVLVFTAFKETMRQLVSYLRKTMGGSIVAFHAGMDPSARKEALQRFQRERGVLISTDTGSEGVNLQFCHSVINYDLPWNPMRIEQRIGRVHRIGQTETVRIYNLATEGTVESYILYLLEKKIDMFNRVIGEIEGILTSLEADFDARVAETLLEWPENEFEKRIEEFGRQLEVATEEYERQQGVLRTLFDRPTVGGAAQGRAEYGSK